ncbi:MAG: hypothetical protein [Bacteriophage sp.]|nr:MAG: hypothetical protein [Bacteriophage sp.]
MKKIKAIIKPKVWRYPEASERQLSRSLAEYAESIKDRAVSGVRAMKFDAVEDDISREEDNLEQFSFEAMLAVIAILTQIGISIYRFNTAQWLIVAKASGGADNQSVLVIDALGASQTEAWYMPKRLLWEKLAEQSIKKLTDAILSDWSSVVRTLALRGATDQEVREAIGKRGDVWLSWSKNRARGIVGTFNSILMRQRLQDAGVTSYFWHGMLDERERPLHVKWEGKEISLYSDHPFPSEPYGCRCWATPNFKGKDA